MQKLRILFAVALSFVVYLTEAQTIHKGTVTDSQTQEPIIGAVILDAESGKAIAVTQIDGSFVIPKSNYSKIKISYLGYKTLVTTAADSGRYVMTPDANSLNEVVVTAQENKGLTSASVIKRHAMEHLQPSSFADLLELLPGGRATTPSLSTPNNIYIREIATGSSNYSTSALGTSFVIDGAPVSTNANMQYLAGAWDNAATSRDNTNAGVDMRTISTDDIEKVEIVRGIPSVEYGDLTSGLVKIERRKGGHDLELRLKSDMGSKLAHVSKGLEWKESNTSLNLSLGYLDYKNDPRNRYETYKRLTLSARANKTWNGESGISELTANFDYTGSFDDEKEDPDIEKSADDSYKSSYNRYSAMVSYKMRMKRQTWLKSFEASLSSSYEYDILERTRLMQLQRMTVAPTSTVEGESDAYILPFRYVGHGETEGKPVNVFAKVSARLSIPSRLISNTLLVGSDWNLDKNLGRGQVFDPTTPVYTGISTRQRKLSDIPANRRLSFFAEEHASLKGAMGEMEVVAGVRASRMTNLSDDYVMNSKFYFDPRANIGYTFPRFTLFGKSATARLSGGLGWHTKMPTMEQLYPDLVYIDFIQLNYYHDNADYRRINIMTYIRNPRNVELEPARNRKIELSGDLNVGGNRLSVTVFRERMTSGFRNQSHYDSYTYKKYDTSTIDAATLTSQLSLDDLTYTVVNELSGYSMYTNGSMTQKEGVEYTFESVRVPVLLTRLTINGAYLRTKYNNSMVDTYRPSVVLDNQQIQYVGLYDNNDGSERESFNTNFTFDTSVPSLRLGFSVSAQCLWFTTSQRLVVNNSPTSYIDPDGTIHPWTDDCASDPYLKYLVREYTASNFQKYTVPFSMNINFKVTKKLMGERLNVAMFCNKLWDYTPDYESNGVTIRRHVTPYFGLEANIKI